MPTTVKWAGSLVATSSIAHGGDTRGTITIFRSELVQQPDGNDVEVPIISGNSFRGRLRRMGEEMLRDVLDYDGQLPTPAVHTLRGGGQLAKTTSPLTGAQIQRLRALVPQIGVFGAAAGGRPLDGCLSVGKVVPCVTEMSHVLGPDVATSASADEILQLETYSNHDDEHDHSLPATTSITDDESSSRLLRYDIQTMKSGTRLRTWIQATRATALELAFITELLDAFSTTGALGGRIARGLGQVTGRFTPTVLTGSIEEVDWRTHVRAHRDEALAALQELT